MDSTKNFILITLIILLNLSSLQLSYANIKLAVLNSSSIELQRNIYNKLSEWVDVKEDGSIKLSWSDEANILSIIKRFPTTLFNTLKHPLPSYNLQAEFWYHGEDNLHETENDINRIPYKRL